MRLKIFLAIATTFILSQNLCAQNTKQLLLLLKNAKATDKSGNKLYPEKFCEMIFKLVTDEIDPADPRVALEDGVTALHWSARYGNVDLTRALCERGVDPNGMGNGLTPIHYAALYDHVEVISVLVDFGADVNVASNLGVTPFHSAASRGCVRAIARLMWHGARINWRDGNGRTALTLAWTNDHVGATALLIAYGANLPDGLNVPTNLNNPQGVAISLVLNCMQHRDPSARFQFLYDHVVSANDGSLALAILRSQLQQGDTILHSAVRLRRVDVLQLVLNYLRFTGELESMINLLNRNYATALSFALQSRNFNAASLMISAGAEPFIGSPSSLTLAYQIPETATFAFNRESSLLHQIHWQTQASIIMRVISFTFDEIRARSHLVYFTFHPTRGVMACYALIEYIVSIALQLELPRHLR